LNNFHAVNDVYSSKQSIKSEQVISHLEHLIELNPEKKVVVFLDNAKFHVSAAIQKFYIEKEGILQLIYLPKYSPKMNPQEHIWNYLKAKLYKPAARGSIIELIPDIKNIFDRLNLDSERIHSLAYARNYLV
jgi:transposase